MNMVIGGLIGAVIGLVVGLLCNGALSSTFGYIRMNHPDYPTTYWGWLKRHGVTTLGLFIVLGIGVGVMFGWASIADGS